MKGLLYTYSLLNKTYFIVAGIIFAASTAAAAVLFGMNKDDPAIIMGYSTFTMLMAIVSAIILMEPITRDLEKNMKSRFLNYSLTGITRRQFMLTQLVINLGSCLVGAVMLLLHYFIVNAACPDTYNIKTLGVMALFILLAGIMEWILIPLTIKLKSSEKAGAVFGFVLGFGVVLPIMITIMNSENPEESFMSADTFSFVTPEVMFIALGVAVAAYIIGWFVISKRVEKGDLC